MIQLIHAIGAYKLSAENAPPSDEEIEFVDQRIRDSAYLGNYSITITGISNKMIKLLQDILYEVKQERQGVYLITWGYAPMKEKIQEATI